MRQLETITVAIVSKVSAWKITANVSRIRRNVGRDVNATIAIIPNINNYDKPVTNFIYPIINNK